MNEEEEFRLWLFWTTPRTMSLCEGFVYCPTIPEPFKNWTKEQWEKEMKRLKNLKPKKSIYARDIKL